jgi:hypothetical protein
MSIDPAGEAGEAADIALASAKLAKDAAAAIPQPDPRDDPAWQLRHAAEKIGALSTRPRRNRWAPLTEIDEKLTALHIQQAQLSRRIAELDQQIADQAELDRQELARWVANKRGERPAAQTPGLQEQRDRAQADLEAVAVAIEEQLHRRLRHVERHRTRMVRQARAEVEQTRDRYLGLVNELRSARADLVDARAAELWAALYPSETATQAAGNTANLCLGLLNPVRESLGITFQIAADQILRGLERDADTIATKLLPEQQKELGTASPTPETEAMWSDDPRAKEWADAKRRELNELARWAHPQQLGQIGQEMRD